MRHLTLLYFCLFLSFSAVSQYSIPQEFLFTFEDIDGNTHSTQDYLDQNKSVFLLIFPNESYSFTEHENLNLINLYNTYGQGGSNDIVVLYLAGTGFEFEADLSNIDYSDMLGAGFENVSFIEDNPIPIGINIQNPTFPDYAGGPDLHVLCTDMIYYNNYAFPTGNSADDYLNQLYEMCCVAGESYDPALSHNYDENIPDCNPTHFEWTISNNTPIPFDNCNIDILINGELEDSFEYIGPLAGCASQSFEYDNLNLVEGDTLTFAIVPQNEQSHNDTINKVIYSVDTISGHLQMELQNVQNEFSGAYIATINQAEFVVAETNWYNQLFIQYPGCMQFQYSMDVGYNLEAGEIIYISSHDGMELDTLVYEEGPLENSVNTKNIFVGTSSDPSIWGFVFEDPDETLTFNPYYTRIPGIEVSQGANSTFTNSEGFYQLPITPNTDIEINYDQSLWPILTTPNSTIYIPNLPLYNFGLNQNDPYWESDSWIDNGIPFVCDNPLSQEVILSNTGNQPIQHDVTFTHDPLLEVDLANTNPTPTSVSGNELSFEITNIPFGYDEAIQVKYTPASAALLGEYLDTEINITTNDIDGNFISTETITTTDSLFCAYDPNDFYGFPLGEGPTGLIAADTDLDYRIRFQNTGNYPAQTVRVTHFVPEELNWESIVPGPTSHEAQTQMNSDTREMTWVFNNINLPDSTTDYEGSNGHVWYKAEMNDLDPGDEIENKAEIYFDQNEAVITNTSLHTISDVVGIETANFKEIKAYPNPATSEVKFNLGDLKGIQSYTVYDKLGRQVQQGSVAKNQITIDISGIETGMYTIVYSSERNTPVAQSRIVKTN